MCDFDVPEHLSPHMRAFYAETANHYALEPDGMKILRLACESWDRAQSAREVIAEEGMVVMDRFSQTKPHPLIAVERDSALRFAKLLRELQPYASQPPRPETVPDLIDVGAQLEALDDLEDGDDAIG